MGESGENEFLIVALGASAGGLEPLERFFTHMPSDAGASFIIVQHLAPDHPTALPDLIARHTEMPVEQARDNVEVAPNRVYIIPPNATLTIKEGILRVSTPAQARGRRTPIDSLFSSLAEDCGEHAVCIMLSGTGTDGTIGLAAIKEYGGMAMAQTLESAKYDSILRSAISTGLVDHILPVEEMPAKLLEYGAHLSAVNGDGKSSAIRDQIGAHLDRIHDVLRRRAGHDFSEYKASTISRRLDRRMKALQIETVKQYLQVLEQQPEEADRLFKDLLIGVTRFFRDPDAFEALGRDVIPRLFEGKGSDSDVRACVVGCATGEEAYSIAILLAERASMLEKPPKLQVFATDIDERGLEMARRGVYPQSIAQHVSPERLARFFTKQDKTYQVKRELRDMCLFSVHSFVKDPPFSRLDLLSCRNVMIYLGADLQRKLIPLFHYALRPQGYLFLGPSENASFHRELFQTVDKKHCIFQRKETAPRPVVAFPMGDNRPAQSIGTRAQLDESHLPRQLERVILQRYRPACVAVKENGDAVFFSGRTGRYLEQPSGAVDVNVVNMAHEGLRVPLRTALHKAVTARDRVVHKQIAVRTNGEVSQVDLTVEPLLEFRAANLYMIVFEDSAETSGSPVTAARAFDADSEETIRHLEEELRSAHEHAQSIFEELESANEELKSANEEYQSTNEELETSKEELESSNEELQTVNSELGRKASELDDSNNDLQNLLNSTQIAAIFLDRELRIKNFTPAAGAVFRLIAGDVGRAITDLAPRLSGIDVVADANQVLKNLGTVERQLPSVDGQYFQMRVIPYRTIHDVIDGVVITFTEVTQLKEAEALAQDIIDTVREPLLVLDGSLRVKAASKAFFRMFHVSANQTVANALFDLGNRQWDIPELRRLLGEVLPENKAIENFQVKHAFPEIGQRTVILNARRIEQANGEEPLILLAIEDSTERSRREESQGLLSAIVQSSEDAIISTDLLGIVRSWNQGAERLFGYTPEDIIGKPVSILAVFERPDEISSELDRLFRGDRIDPYDTMRRTKDGRTIPVSIAVSAILDSSGNIIGASKIVRDIAGQVAAEKALRESEARLQSLNTDLQQFAYAASHDLQEPLRMVISYTQLLAREYRGKLDERADQFIATAVAGALQMETLLRDLREYWAVNEQVEHTGPVNCTQALEKALGFLLIAIRESNAIVTRDALPTVIAEELPLVLLFQNLVGNALKYHQPNVPPQVHISAKRDADFWTFAVGDNGIGIEAEHLERVFAPFKRLHGRENPGTGMGLAICQKIVERYGGQIWVESTYGRGSTFKFTLPA